MGGVREPNVIDLVTYDAATGEYALIMIEERPWTDSPEQLAQLSEKINNYAMFALDEGLLRATRSLRATRCVFSWTAPACRPREPRSTSISLPGGWAITASGSWSISSADVQPAPERGGEPAEPLGGQILAVGDRALRSLERTQRALSLAQE